MKNILSDFKSENRITLSYSIFIFCLFFLGLEIANAACYPFQIENIPGPYGVTDDECGNRDPTYYFGFFVIYIFVSLIVDYLFARSLMNFESIRKLLGLNFTFLLFMAVINFLLMKNVINLYGLNQVTSQEKMFSIDREIYENGNYFYLAFYPLFQNIFAILFHLLLKLLFFRKLLNENFAKYYFLSIILTIAITVFLTLITPWRSVLIN